MTGDKQLDRKLKRLRESVQRRITKSAVTAALRVGAKETKTLIPSQYKAARKGIGHSLKKNRKKNVVEAKVGVAVGKKRAKLQTWSKKITDKRRAEGKRGLGITPLTLHWFIAGTKRTKAKWPGLAAKGMAKAERGMRTVLRQKVWSGIKREAAKT